MARVPLEVGDTTLPIGHSLRLADDKLVESEEGKDIAEMPQAKPDMSSMPTSSLFDRLQTFMPKMEAAMEELQTKPAEEVSMEDVDDSKPYVQMDVGVVDPTWVDLMQAAAKREKSAPPEGDPVPPPPSSAAAAAAAAAAVAALESRTPLISDL